MTVHLFVRSCYSLLDSTVRIPFLIEKAKKEGAEHVCLTDHRVMYGAAAFLRACKNANLHGILGMEAEVDYQSEVVPFVLLAKDNLGYLNLMKLSSYYGEGNKSAPLNFFLKCCDHNILIAYGEGGYCDSELVNDDQEGLLRKMKQMKQDFPPFYFALSYQEASLWKSRNGLLKRLANANGVPTVAMNKVFYLEKEEADDFRCVRGIRLNKTVHDSTLPMVKGRYYLSEAEMASLYEPDDIERCEEIAKECRSNYVLEKTDLPEYQNKEGAPSDVYLKALCYAGLKKRLNGIPNKTYEERLNYELGIITKMHFENYFLIVYDFIKAARKKDIYVGPGRGSACGSLVAYCLGITQIDPIHYHLLFERFLNPERISMPDIDTDIPDTQRNEVIQYVYDKYGCEHVANVIAFGTLGARQVLHDVAKYLDLRNIDSVLKLIPKSTDVTLTKVYNENAKLKQLISSDPNLQRLYRYAVRLEGLPRHTTLHAAGIIMSRKPLSEVIPTIHNEDLLTSQYSADYLEERGLIKMDFLANRNLSTIDAIVKRIQKDNPSFRIMNIPLDDTKTYSVFAKADTAGVFQFESEGMKNLLRRIKPACFEDVVAALALFRPASKDSIPAYIEGKTTGVIHYPVKELEPVLKETYGVMVYQEQAMLTAEICAGFSLGRADVLRKAMSKKKIQDLENLKGEFVRGCLKKNYSEETANSLFELVSQFGGYGFNKSHAVAYAMVAYQMAYLKANYPTYFYIALFNSVIGDREKTSRYVDEARRRGLTIVSPNANLSESLYVVKDNHLVLPMACIKGVGRTVSDALVEERNAHGPYQDYFDFVARALLHKVNKKTMELLIDAGTLDCFGWNRPTLKAAMEDAYRFGELVQIQDGDTTSLNLGLVTKPQIIRQKEDVQLSSSLEREALGFCLGTQPIEILRKKMNILDPSLSEILNLQGYANSFAQIESVRQHRTKKGDMMAFLKVSDETAMVDMAVMPRLYAKVSNDLVRGAYIRFRAKISQNDSILAEDILRVNERGV